MQLGLEIEEPRFWECLGEDISSLILGRYISDAQMFQLDLFSHEVVVNFHVLSFGHGRQDWQQGKLRQHCHTRERVYVGVEYIALEIVI